VEGVSEGSHSLRVACNVSRLHNGERSVALSVGLLAVLDVDYNLVDWCSLYGRCPRGRRLLEYEDRGGTAAVCQPINECLELRDACHGGRCIDVDDGYRCDCVPGRGGPTCAERRQESRLARVDIRAGAVAIIAICLLLLLCEYANSTDVAETA